MPADGKQILTMIVIVDLVQTNLFIFRFENYHETQHHETIFYHLCSAGVAASFA